MLNLYSHTTLPVSASSAITRSCRSGPRPDGFCTYTRLPITIGADRPPYGTRQRKFWPFSANFSGRPVSFEMPSRFGPRASGQSPTATPRGAAGGVLCCADATSPAAVTSAKIRLLCFRIIILRSRLTAETAEIAETRITKLSACSAPSAIKRDTQNVTPARNPNVRGAPASPTNPDGARPGYGSATGIYRVSNALRTQTSPNARLPRSPARRFVSVYASWPTVFASSYW